MYSIFGAYHESNETLVTHLLPASAVSCGYFYLTRGSYIVTPTPRDKMPTRLMH